MPDAYRTSEIRKIKKAGTAEDVKETFNSIGDRQFRAVATKVQKSASQVAFLFLSRNLDMSARQTGKACVHACTICNPSVHNFLGDDREKRKKGQIRTEK